MVDIGHKSEQQMNDYKCTLEDGQVGGELISSLAFSWVFMVKVLGEEDKG